MSGRQTNPSTMSPIAEHTAKIPHKVLPPDTTLPQNSTAGGTVPESAGGGGALLNVTSSVTNNTAATLPSSGGDGGHGLPGGVIALLLCLLLLGVAVVCVFLYLKRSGRLYKMVPFTRLQNTPRRSSLSSSRPLDGQEDRELGPPVDDAENREDRMFTIDDFDMESVDMERNQRGGNDEYFYDEVFGKSMFEDETTNTSMRQLTLTSERDITDDDIFDVDIMADSIAAPKSQTATT